MKRSLVLLVAVAGTLAALLAASSAHAATTRYVDNTGSCSDTTGTPAYCTIQAAVDASSAGDTIDVAAGTYAENVVLGTSVTLNGAQAGVDARGRSASETIIDPTSGSGINLETGSAGSTIDGFTFSGPGRQIQSSTGPIDGVTVKDNRFLVQSGGDGMFLNDTGTDVTIDQNSFDGGGDSGTLLHLDTDTFNGIWITNNWIKNASGSTGLFSDGNRNVNPSGDRSPKLEGNVFDSDETGANLGRGSWSDASIADNTFTNNLLGLQGGIASSTLSGNTFDGNGLWGLELTGLGKSGPTWGAQDDMITGNTFTDNGNAPDGYASLGPAAIYFSSSQDAGTISTNAAHDNNITGNAAGVVYDGSETIDVTCNWWGSSSGPSGDGPGSGDSVNGSFDYQPWLTAPAPGGRCNGPLQIPTSTAQCKQGGWMNLVDANGTPFKNQGDCVSYVATDGTNGADG